MLSFLSTGDIAGRFDTQSLPTQARMELLVAGLDDIAAFTFPSGETRPFEQWEGVQVSEKTGEVTRISCGDPMGDFENHTVVGPGGSIDLQYIPPSVKRFTFRMCQLLGTVETALLPRGLVYLDLQGNQLSGEFDLSALPVLITLINISRNQFCGSFAFEAVPATIAVLHAGSNVFSGTVDMTKIPQTLRSLRIDHNTIKQETLLVGNLPATLLGITVDLDAFQRIEHVGGQRLFVRKSSKMKNWARISLYLPA